MKQALISTIGFCIFFALQIVLQKLFLRTSLFPVHLTFLTNLFSFIILTTYYLIFDRKIFSFKMPKHIALLFFISVLLWVFADLFMVFGLKFSSSINFAILSRITVIITYILAILFFGEKLKTNKSISVLLAFLGAFIIIYNFSNAIVINFGNIFFLVFAAFISISSLVRQKIIKHISSFQLTYLMYGLSVIILGVIVFILFPIKELKYMGFIIVNSVLALLGFNLVNYAIAKNGASFFSVVSSLLPFFTAILSFLILKQLPTINQIFGAMIIIFSISLFQKK